MIDVKRLRDVILIRHGQTDWNAAERIQSHHPVPLNDEGRAQVSATAALLTDIAARQIGDRPPALWCSPLTRARQSAEIVHAALDLEVSLKEHRGLIEFDMGAWTGKTLGELRKLPAWQDYLTKPAEMRFPKGEALTEVRTRAVTALQEILDSEDTNTVIIVSHGGVIRLLTVSLLNLDLNQYHRMSIDNASITRAWLVPGRGARLACINHVPVLRPML